MWEFPYKALYIFIAISFAELVFSQDVSPSVVQTKNGPLQGILKQSRAGTNYVAFLGLRYANPPKRFEPPKALEDTWTEPRIADNPGPQCTQLVFGPPGENESVNQSEDCLYLHVYVPQSQLEASTSKHLPVMFWVHGGGFITGDGFNYSPEYFMDNGDVIIVTVNYRLGVFGFLGTGRDNTVTANNGLRDVVQALKWVQDNVASFKGNPSEVTLFGNSAGSASVHFLLMTPLAEGLFQRAILQSGSFSFWSYDFDPKETALKLAKYMECPLTSDGEELSAEIRKCLEGKTATELNTAQIMFWPRWPEGNIIARFVPTAEEGRANPFFAGPPGAMFGKGRKLTYVSKVPTIVGVMKDEGSLLFATMVLSDEKALNALRERWNELLPKALCIDTFISTKHFPKASEKIREFYFGSKDVSLETSQNLSDMYSDALFLVPVLLAGQEMAKDGITVYPYIFSYDGEWSV